MLKLIFIALAGAVGALSRYGISGLACRVFGDGFPYGTFIVNIIGCFLLGLVMKISITTTAIPDVWRIPIAIGFLGAMTTFSTFSYETVRLIETGSFFLVAINIAVNVIVGITAIVTGFATAKIIAG